MRIKRVAAELLISSFLLSGCSRLPGDAKGIEENLRRAIPLKSTPDQVLRYLTAQRIEHSPYLKGVTKAKTIQAVIRERSKWSLVQTSYYVDFTFDDQDRLICYRVQPEYTGP